MADDGAYKIEIQTPMGDIQLVFKDTVSGNTVSGEGKAGPIGSSSFKGTRA